MRVLGMDALAIGKREGARENANGLPREADEIHLDAALGLVVDGVMREAAKVEIAIELAVDPGEQIEVERRGHAARIVIGGKQNRRRFLQVDTDQKDTPWAEQLRGIGQESLGFDMGQIADGRA